MSKTIISLRIDKDVLNWFRTEFPKGYQTKLHDILKQYKERALMESQYKAGKAQQLFRQFYAQCFWHLKADLVITPDLIPMVQQGLREYGGRKGYQLADELEKKI